MNHLSKELCLTRGSDEEAELLELIAKSSGVLLSGKPVTEESVTNLERRVFQQYQSGSGKAANECERPSRNSVRFACEVLS